MSPDAYDVPAGRVERPRSQADAATVAAAGERLVRALATTTPCEPVRDLIGRTDVAAAYLVQGHLNASRAAAGARVVALLTEWDQFRGLDPRRLGEVVAQRAVVDARGALDPDAWRAAGWSVRALGAA